MKTRKAGKSKDVNPQTSGAGVLGGESKAARLGSLPVYMGFFLLTLVLIILAVEGMYTIGIVTMVFGLILIDIIERAYKVTWKIKRDTLAVNQFFKTVYVPLSNVEQAIITKNVGTMDSTKLGDLLGGNKDVISKLSGSKDVVTITQKSGPDVEFSLSKYSRGTTEQDLIESLRATVIDS